MKTLIILTTMVFSSFMMQSLHAQVFIEVNEEIELELEKLEAQKEKIENTEKEKLRVAVEKINQQLEEGEITAEEAKKLKKEEAEKRALNIENQLTIIDQNIALLERNALPEDTDDEEALEDATYYAKMKYLDTDSAPRTEAIDSIPRRTISNVILAFGLNNTLMDGQSLDDSPYEIGGSRFFELGYEFTTTLTQKGFVRLKYGLAFQFNGLKPTENRYFVEDGDQTRLEEFDYKLNKSKLRMDNLVVPLHLEFGSSDIVYCKDKPYYSAANQFRIGFGGYAGVNLNTLQKLKYEEDGKNRKTKLSDPYNTSNFVYGLSGYIGYDWGTLYAKYDLNPVFTDNPIDEHNISVGLRFFVR